MASPFDPSALVRARLIAQLTQDDLAQRIGVAKWTVAAWERGRQQPTAKRFPPMAAALDCDVAALLHQGPTTPRILRYRAGLTIAQLAERADVPRSTVADVDDGRFKPSQAPALAAALGVTPEEFSAAVLHRQQRNNEWRQ